MPHGARPPLKTFALHGSALLKFRDDLNLSQAEFWPLWGIAQCTGSRYETAGRCSRQVQMLIMLYLNGIIDQPMLEKAQAPANKLTQEDFLGARDKLKLDQREFWPTFGVRQGNGSRFERVCRPQQPLRLLLHFVNSGVIDMETLDAVAQRIDRARKRRKLAQSAHE